MGADPRAILYYGVKLREKPKDWDSVNDAWADDHKPTEPEGKHDNYSGPAWDNWRAEVKVYEATPRYVEIDWSGSEGSAEDSWYVHCPCFDKTVEWAEQIDLGSPVVFRTDPEADDYLRSFCDRFGLEFRAPSWHLAVRYF